MNERIPDKVPLDNRIYYAIQVKRTPGHKRWGASLLNIGRWYDYMVGEPTGSFPFFPDAQEQARILKKKEWFADTRVIMVHVRSYVCEGVDEGATQGVDDSSGS